jgi:hypothetical protein
MSDQPGHIIRYGEEAGEQAMERVCKMDRLHPTSSIAA